MPWNLVTREQRAQILGTLVKEFQDLDLAEEGLQEAWEEALKTWKTQGVPSRPVGWLIVVAKRRILDVLRRRKVLERKQEQWYREHGAEAALVDPAAAYPDGRLMMLFTSCHPALALEARAVLNRAQADLHHRLPRVDEARQSYRKALDLAPNPRVAAFLTAKLQELC